MIFARFYFYHKLTEIQKQETSQINNDNLFNTYDEREAVHIVYSIE